jgi:D-glycero-alpha-D-manno-heptose 1-phosphate guanylyltransferase
MRAIVLAGGLGTRLRGVVGDLPKPMAPVAGRPFLAWILDRLVGAGFDRAVLAVGYRHEAIRSQFGQAYEGLPLVYSMEEQPLGTGGAIRLAAEHVDAKHIFVLNGDTFLAVDYAAMQASHLAAGERLSIGVPRVDDAARYGALEIEHGHVRAFHEKGRVGPGVINGGTYLVSRDVIESIPCGEPFSFEQQLLVPRVAELRPAAFECSGLFIDIGVPEDYARAQELFDARRFVR